jgi:tetratricopeptide (TPR) repeat protein
VVADAGLDGLIANGLVASVAVLLAGGDDSRMAKPGRAGRAWIGAVALAVGLGWAGFQVGSGLGAGLGAVAGGFTPLLVERASRRQESVEAARRVIEPEHGPAGLLHPALGVVPFVGRERELAALEDWCTDGNIGLVRLVTGGGGSGKTRLALELVRRMNGRGWECVPVAEDAERQAVAAERAVASRAGLLLVVDYAEARTGLEGLLEAAARDEGRDEGRVRVLLLARQAGDWWDRLHGGGAAVRGLVRDAGEAVIELGGGLGRGMSAVEEVRRAVRFFALRLSVAAPDVDLTGLAADSGMEVLDLHATALVAVLSAHGAGGRVDVDAALGLEELLGHEKRYWRGRAQAAGLLDGPHGLSMAQLSQVAAAGCLLGLSSAAELGRRVPGVAASEAVVRWLRELYPPGPAGELGVLRPDRLAELHVSRELGGSPGLARACLTGLDQEQARRALVLLARASAEHAAARVLLESSLARFADVLDAVTAPREVMISIVDVTAIEEAVTTYRALAEARPDTFLPGFAMALNNQALRLADLGRPKEALTAIKEAVTTYRALAEARPDAFLPDLAMALNNQALRLADLGRPKEALTAIKEAVTIRRTLAETRPDAFLPSLAGALDNQSNQLAELGRPEEALTAIEEAVTTYRALADDRPDVFARRYANSLETRDAILSALGREADADAPPE